MLDLVDLDQPALEGQRQFISCWVWRSPELTFLVDPGPRSTADVLLARLRELGVDRLDIILLTHVHLDHAGATAAVLAAHPQARVVCHEKGRRHIVEPTRLWEGSRKVLGATAEAYGEPAPVMASSLATFDEIADRGIVTVDTPGHAPHHLSFVHEETLFAGEAAGTYIAMPGGHWYLRPATPPRFVPEIALASLDRLLALTPVPRRIAFAHHGLHEGHVVELLRFAREQLCQWLAAARTVSRNQPGAGFQALADACLGRLAAGDPHYALRRDLPADIQVREDQFSRQTLRGIFQAVDASVG